MDFSPTCATAFGFGSSTTISLTGYVGRDFRLDGGRRRSLVVFVDDGAASSSSRRRLPAPCVAAELVVEGCFQGLAKFTLHDDDLVELMVGAATTNSSEVSSS